MRLRIPRGLKLFGRGTMQYVLPHEARDELLKRTHLKSAVTGYLGEMGVSTPFDFKKPTAFVGMPAMLRVDTVSAVNLSEQCELDLAWGTYDGDKFSHRCKIKMSMVSPVFTSRLDKSGNFIPKGRRFLKKPDDYVGMKISELSSDNGFNIANYHKDRMREAMPEIMLNDMTDWLGQFGNSSGYYDAFLSLFIAHSVLLDDFHGGEVANEVLGFTERVAAPAFERVSKRFGVEPLVVKLPWKPHYSYHLEGDMVVNWRQTVLPRL